MGVSLDLQNDGAHITLTARLLLKFTVAGWDEMGKEKPYSFYFLSSAYVLDSLHQ